MGTTDISLERVFNQLIKGNVGLAIAETDTYLSAWPHAQSREKLDTLKEEYRLMADYWQQGVKDPQLEEQYQRLLQRVYVLCGNISIHRHIASSSFLQGLYQGVRQQGRSWSLDAVRHEMENFVSEVAMLELEPAHLREEKSLDLYRQHQQQVNQLFNYIVTSHLWTDGIGEMMEQLLLLPTVDTVDQQLLVSAVMFSLMNRFDIAKFRTLVNVYRKSHDEQVRQRALVGWVMGIDDDFLAVYPEQQTLIGELLTSSHVCQELTELQIQLVYAQEAEQDTKTITQEIMPDLMKHNNFRISEKGLEEVEEDPMEDILHPGASEERMEKLESSFQRMVDMHRRGADVYFGGFSQMKRFPFFYEMANWLVPFYLQHPDISHFVRKMGDNHLLDTLLGKDTFCNSDKYSFVIAFQQVVDRLPEQLLEMMKRGELSVGELVAEEQQQTPAFIRRSYLMDLYRFFRLFPNRSVFCNPFDTKPQQLGMLLFMSSSQFCHTPLDSFKREVYVMLKKHHLERDAEVLLTTFPEEMHDVQYFLWTGDYEAVLEHDPDNERALSGYAREAFRRGNYQDAEDAYAQLLTLHPEKSGYMLSRAVCLMKMEDYDTALKLLYQLDYEQPDNVSVTRALAWALTCDGKVEQAENVFMRLMPAATGEDYQNHAYCLWLSGRIADAAENFRKYVAAESVDATGSFLDRRWLQVRGISETDINMMEALVAG